jgi:hypothetical protein
MVDERTKEQVKRLKNTNHRTTKNERAIYPKMIELKHNNPERNLENGSTKQPITT